MVLPAAVRLPGPVLASLVEREGLGELHPALASAAVWRDPHEHDLLAARVDERLTTLGWRNRDRRLDREVRSVLAVLCRPEVAYYGWLTHGGATTAVLAAAVGREGVLAVREADGTVRLTSVGCRRLAERLVGQLPDVPPGAGTPVVVSLSELWATDRRGRQRVRGGVVTRQAPQEVLRVKELLALPTTGAGELYAHGHAQPLCYVDTTGGRYVVTRVGPDAVRVGPARQPGLVAHLDGIRLGA